MTRIAFYPGTFDPPTNGHVALLTTALALAERVVIAVGINAGKTPMFALPERLAMVSDVIGGLDPEDSARVSTISFEGLTVDAARKAGASIILRGIRDGTDFDYEMQLAGMNHGLSTDIHTVFVPAAPGVRHITATLVRQIAALGGDVSPFVPPAVVSAIAKHYRR